MWWDPPAWVEDARAWRVACAEVAALAGDGEALDELRAWSPAPDYADLRAAVEAGRTERAAVWVALGARA